MLLLETYVSYDEADLSTLRNQFSLKHLVIDSIQLEAACTNELVVFATLTAASIALEVNVEANDVVNPIGRHVQEVSRLQNHFIAFDFIEIWKFRSVGVAPVHLAVSSRWVSMWQHVHIHALIRVG